MRYYDICFDFKLEEEDEEEEEEEEEGDKGIANDFCFKTVTHVYVLFAIFKYLYLNLRNDFNKLIDFNC